MVIQGHHFVATSYNQFQDSCIEEGKK